MEKELVKTKDLGVHEFSRGILVSGANLLSPVIPGARPATFQTLEYQLENTGKIIQQGIQEWATYAGVVGVAQYSLMKGKAGVLGRANTRFRWAEDDEIMHDLNAFGDQVVGPPVDEADEKLKKGRQFKFFGKPHIYTGPERLVKITIVSRVFSGDFPSDISSLINEVDEASDNIPTTVSQGYYLFHAEEGRLYHQAFGKPELFDPKKMQLHGRVERTDKNMWWLPEGSDHRADFTPEIYRE